MTQDEVKTVLDSAEAAFKGLLPYQLRGRSPKDAFNALLSSLMVNYAREDSKLHDADVKGNPGLTYITLIGYIRGAFSDREELRLWVKATYPHYEPSPPPKKK